MAESEWEWEWMRNMERAWLDSDNPTNMLADAATNSWAKKISYRKLRLFACACFRRNAAGIPDQQLVAAACEAWADGGARPTPAPGDVSYAVYHADAEFAAVRIVAGSECAAQEADVLREVVGNPFNPAKMPFVALGPQPCPDCPEGRPEADCDDCGGRGEVIYWGCPWLTPDAAAVAAAAYDFSDPATGRLDPVRLAVLADVLEEAGFPTSENARWPLHVSVYPDPPDGWAVQIAGYHLMPDSPKKVANFKRREAALREAAKVYGVRRWITSWRGSRGGASGAGREMVAEPSPLLAHLRSPGPHVKGCWALDLVLGRE